jgi:hypothetical protein
MQSPARLDPEPDLDNANVGMSEKVLQKSCRQNKQAASKKDIACFLFHVKRSRITQKILQIYFCFKKLFQKQFQKQFQ